VRVICFVVTMKGLLTLCCLVLGFLCFEVSGQAGWDSVRICAIACSDGSTVAKCCDMFGAMSSGDCFYAKRMGMIDCPSPLHAVSDVYDLGANQDMTFTNIDDCQRVFDKWKTSPNLPVIVNDNVTAPVKARGYDPIREAMNWHKDFSKYTAEEQLILGQRIVQGGNKQARDRSYTDQELRDLARGMFGFVQTVREKTNKTGVYSNSKCAGCSLIVQSIEERLTSSACDSITSVIKGTVCGSNPVFETFCSAIISATGVEQIVEGLCLSAFNNVIGATGIRDRANYICSSLTCTSPPEQVTSENDIMGSCKIVNGAQDKRSLNERCDELIRICDMAEKGLCISDSLNEIKEMLDDGFVKAGINTILSLVNGELPPAVEAAKKAAKCSGVKCGGGDDDSSSSIHGTSSSIHGTSSSIQDISNLISSDDSNTTSQYADSANRASAMLSVGLAFVFFFLTHF